MNRTNHHILSKISWYNEQYECLKQSSIRNWPHFRTTFAGTMNKFSLQNKLREWRRDCGENGKNEKGNCYHCIEFFGFIDNNRLNKNVVVILNQPCHIGCIIDTRCLVCLHTIQRFYATAVMFIAHPMKPLFHSHTALRLLWVG